MVSTINPKHSNARNFLAKREVLLMKQAQKFCFQENNQYPQNQYDTLKII